MVDEDNHEEGVEEEHDERKGKKGGWLAEVKDKTEGRGQMSSIESISILFRNLPLSSEVDPTST